MKGNTPTLKFVKMQGCGNDYIYFDCFEQQISDPAALSIQLSQQHFGIGGDGIILICPSKTADAEMRIFNKDGSEGNMCGNGIRCVGKYLYDSGRASKELLTVDTKSGRKTLRLACRDGYAEHITVEMGSAVFDPPQIPICLKEDQAWGWPLEIQGTVYPIHCVSMGNPHCVLFVDQTDQLDLERIGPCFEHHPLFPQRINTEFVQLIERNHLRMRVWERGSGETMACGTGACASASCAVRAGLCDIDREIQVDLLGGTLQIRYTPEMVYMTGPACTVFWGEVPFSEEQI